jgi:hypothetical protein
MARQMESTVFDDTETNIIDCANAKTAKAKETPTNEKKQAPQQRAVLAHHEAGHAVAAYRLGMRIYSVSIVPDKYFRGHLHLPDLLARVDLRTRPGTSAPGHVVWD